MSVEVRRLSFAYGRLRALTEIDAAARPGRITAVIGPNAAGKSTLLRCIIGALAPDQGCALIDGRPSHRLSTRDLARRIAYVPQRSVVSAAFTVRQVVQLGRYALPSSRKRIDDALRALELEDIAERPYPALSVGQQQRVTLARAVAQLAPDGHLILDEPVSAMDLSHVHHCMRLLRSLAADGATVLVAIHDLPLAAAVVDDVWLLDTGRLVAAGSLGEVLTPASLERIFGVRFEWVSDHSGRRSLLAAIDHRSPVN